MKKTFILISLLFATSQLFGQTYQVSANINAASEVPTNTSPGNGTLTGTYNAETNMISLTVTYVNLVGSLTASHLHQAPVGSNGGVIVNLGPATGMMAGTFSNTYTVPEVNEAELISGNFYINIHTSSYGGGEIRGQLALTLLPESLCASEVTFGDLCIKDSTKGVILKSPNGTCFRIQVGDNGMITSTQVTCP